MASRRHITAFFFLLSFLSAQAVVMFAEIDHPLHEPDNSCDICLAVNHLSNGLVTFESDVQLQSSHVITVFASSISYIKSRLTAYTVRAPPLL